MTAHALVRVNFRPQGEKPARPTDAGTDQVRACDQPQDRKGAGLEVQATLPARLTSAHFGKSAAASSNSCDNINFSRQLTSTCQYRDVLLVPLPSRPAYDRGGPCPAPISPSATSRGSSTCCASSEPNASEGPLQRRQADREARPAGGHSAWVRGLKATARGATRMRCTSAATC